MVLAQLQAAEDVQYPFKSQKQQVFPRVFGSDREIGGSIECTDKITTPTHLSLALRAKFPSTSDNALGLLQVI